MINIYAGISSEKNVVKVFVKRSLDSPNYLSEILSQWSLKDFHVCVFRFSFVLLEVFLLLLF